MKTRMGLRGQLLAIGILLTAFLVAIGASGLIATSMTASSYGKINREILPGTIELADMRTDTKEMIVNILKLCLPGILKADSDKSIQNLEALGKSFETSRRKFMLLNLDDRQKLLLEETFKAWKELDETQTQVVFQAASTDADDRKAAVQTVNTDFKMTYENLFQKIDQLADYQREIATSQAQVADQVQHKLSLILSFTVFGAVTCSILLLFVFSRRLSSDLMNLTKRLSDGAEVLTGASAGIASFNQQIAQAGVEQAATIQASSSAARQIEQLIFSNLEHTQNSSLLADSNVEAASQGKASVDKMVSAIQGIRESNRRISEQMELSNLEIDGIVRVIDKIAEKTKVINDIVFQTKLLSFNASVEAARAGEHGKGFSVVAEEVGSLAKMSGEAAKEISAILTSSTDQVRRVVKLNREKVAALITDADTKVNSGVAVAELSRNSLAKILANGHDLRERLNKISIASQEESQGVKNISTSVYELDRTMSQNAEALQSAENAAGQLHAQAEGLQDVSRVLTQTVFGGGKTSSAPLKKAG